MKLNEAPDDRLVGAYVKYRDEVAAIEARHKEELSGLKEKMHKIEMEFLRRFIDRGAESVRTNSGTVYRSVRTSATVADRDVYFNWVLQDPAERMSFLEARANKTLVQQYKGEHAELPPGINWREEATVGFRRA